MNFSSPSSSKAEVLLRNNTLYVSASGSDGTGDGSQAKPFATIQRAINTLPKNMGGTTNTINVAAGEYPGFKISGLYGGSYSNKYGISIVGDSGGGTIITGGVEVYSCEAPVSIENVEVTGMANDCNISCLSSGVVRLLNCKCTGTAAESGIWIGNTRSGIYGCTISDKTNYALRISGCVCFASLIEGQNNKTCFQVGASALGLSGMLIGDRHDITGTVKYARDRGGIIFADGALA